MSTYTATANSDSENLLSHVVNWRRRRCPHSSGRPPGHIRTGCGGAALWTDGHWQATRPYVFALYASLCPIHGALCTPLGLPIWYGRSVGEYSMDRRRYSLDSKSPHMFQTCCCVVVSTILFFHIYSARVPLPPTISSIERMPTSIAWLYVGSPESAAHVVAHYVRQ